VCQSEQQKYPKVITSKYQLADTQTNKGTRPPHIWELIHIFALWAFIHQREWTLLFSNKWRTEIPLHWKYGYCVLATPPKCNIAKVAAWKSVVLSYPLLNRQTEQSGHVKDTDQPQMYQPNRESSAIKIRKQGRTRTYDV
jgi:hypothetical protein